MKHILLVASILFLLVYVPVVALVVLADSLHAEWLHNVPRARRPQ